MEAPTLTIDDQVDVLLHKVAMSPNLTLGVHELYGVPVMDESMYRLEHFMIEKGILKVTGDRRSITGKGLEIVNFGGWAAYRKQLSKQKPRSLYTFESAGKKQDQAVDIAALRCEILHYKNELEQQRARETESSKMISNLIEQNKQSKLMTFITGVAVGIVIAGALSLLLISNF